MCAIDRSYTILNLLRSTTLNINVYSSITRCQLQSVNYRMSATFSDDYMLLGAKWCKMSHPWRKSMGVVEIRTRHARTPVWNTGSARHEYRDLWQALWFHGDLYLCGSSMSALVGVSQWVEPSPSGLVIEGLNPSRVRQCLHENMDPRQSMRL